MMVAGHCGSGGACLQAQSPGTSSKETIVAAFVKKVGPAVLGLATLAGLFLAGGGSFNID